MNIQKPKPMKDIKIKYYGKEYDNVLSLNRGYDYSSFRYLDNNGSEVSVYLEQGKTFEIITKAGDK